VDDIEKSTFRELWQQLGHNQRRFAIAMIGASSKKEAAQAIGISPNTTYGWNGVIDEVVELLLTHSADSAMSIIEAEAPRAAMIKSSGLDSDNEKIRQDAASEILDRNLGKPTQRQEVTGKDGSDLNVITYITENRPQDD